MPKKLGTEGKSGIFVGKQSATSKKQRKLWANATNVILATTKQRHGIRRHTS